MVNLKSKQNKLLWIPRSLLIFVWMFYLDLVIGCLIYSHQDMKLFFPYLIAILLFLLISFYREILSGILLLLLVIGSLIFLKGFNSFIYLPYTILAIAGVLMVFFPFLYQKNLKTEIEINSIIKSSKPRRYGWLWVLLPCFLLITHFILLLTIIYPSWAMSESMSPSIRTNAFLLINRIAYRTSKPKRGDIISFAPDFDQNKSYTKRVIGVPGDLIEWRDYQIYVNGKKLVEPHQFDSFTKTYKQTNEFPTIKLKEDEYFVLGDNRMASNDSRYIGTIKRESITGKVYFIHNPKEE